MSFARSETMRKSAIRPWAVGATLAGAMTLGGGDGLRASGIYRDGIGARSMALGGADVTLRDSPLAAMTANPAALGGVGKPAFDLGLTVALPDGDLHRNSGSSGSLWDSAGALPELAVTFPVTETLGLGVSVAAEAMLAGDWGYEDAPGGLSGGTSYGWLRHRSEIALVRTALGAGIALGEKWSVGGSIGLLYNRNRLDTAYVFQSHPVLRGFKTLVDLDTDGFGVDGEFGVQFRPQDNLHFALTYRLPSTVRADGTLTGRAEAELAALGGDFAGVRPDFAYAAEVENEFPQSISAGMGWAFHEGWLWLGQVDWIEWSQAFKVLPLRLRHGNNDDLNGFLGSDAIDDDIPLAWKDRWVFRTGLEYAPNDHWSFRAGYSYGKSPAPDRTLNPLNAAILEHTLGAGAGYRWGRYVLDAAWQWQLPARQRVDMSDLAAGEYSRSSVEVEIHWIGVTAGMRF